MAINLIKGQKIDLTKTNPNLSKAIIGLGWDANKYAGAHAFDLDASAFLVGADGRVSNPNDFIFYNNLKARNNCVIHTGDNLTGEGDGDDEQLIINFSCVPHDVYKIAITVTIHEADFRSQNFGQVSNAFVRVVNEANNEEILRYDLAEEFSVETALVICEIYKYNNEWKFSAVGSGFQGGLKALCQNYGLEVD